MRTNSATSKIGSSKTNSANSDKHKSKNRFISYPD
jgi:hypothetical protein